MQNNNRKIMLNTNQSKLFKTSIVLTFNDKKDLHSHAHKFYCFTSMSIDNSQTSLPCTLPKATHRIAKVVITMELVQT